MRIYILLFVSLFMTSCTGSMGGIFSSTDNVETQGSTNATYDSRLQKTITSPTFGSGKHTITIYADFQCPACISFSVILGDIFQGYADAGKTVLVYKQYPLTSIHKNAYRDAIAALCAAEQDKYLVYKKTLYALEKDKAGATVSDADRIEIARANGLDVAIMTQCLAENRYAKQVENEIAEGDAAGITATPTILLDGKRLDIGAIFADLEKGKAFMERVLAQ